MPLVSKTVQVEQINHLRTGMRMRELRKSRRVSIRTLAVAMGFTAPYICDLELGKRNWSVELARKYEAALKTVCNRGF